MKGEHSNRDLKAAVAFLLPNFLGFCVFTAGPVIFSLVVAFSNWNLMRTIPFRWIGFENFGEMFGDPKFWLYFINTGYLMLGMPIAIACSLFLAILLTQRLRGIVAYRTMFYLPTFTAGVALLILWKALYSPDFGPINNLVKAAQDGLTWLGQTLPAHVLWYAGFAVLALAALATLRTARSLVAGRRSGALGRASVVLPAGVAAVPALLFGWPAWLALWLVLTAAGMAIGPRLREGGERVQPGAFDAFGGTFWASVGRLVIQMLLIGVGWALVLLPIAAVGGVTGEPPQWLVSTNNLLGLKVEQVGISAEKWGLGAREALIFMGVWIGIGGNNMLLYIAALTNIPQELYEAAQIDGAGRWAAFRNVTWPQLAPTTFFIVVMSCIGGLQGGFQQARVMTQGGPSGTTTTLAYYIYRKAFLEFQIGYASAVAWVLFTVIFVVTLVNWKFGAKELNY